MASAEAVARLLSNPNLSSREKIRLREQAVKTGVIGTSQHLGSATPEVIAQLQKSSSQQKFSSKKQSLDRSVAELTARGIVSGNSSTRPELSKQTAKETFKIQQNVTKNLGQQVQDIYKSKEFAKIKEEGTKGGTVTTNQQFTELLNKKNIALPTFQRNIVNELAQKDIQGETQTQENISRILNQAGFRNAGVKVNEDGTINTGLASEEVLKPIIDQLNALLKGSGSAPDVTPDVTEDVTPKSNILDSIIGFISSPLGIGLIIGSVVLFYFMTNKNRGKK